MLLKREWLILGIIPLCVLLIIISSISFSYAVPPSACDNRADAKILSLKIHNGKKTVDILSKHIKIINASIRKGYSVELSLVANSKDFSSDKGSIWLTTTAYGFSSGMCINEVKFSSSSETLVHVSINDIQMGQAVKGLIQQVKWGSWPDTDQATYNVRWR